MTEESLTAKQVQHMKPREDRYEVAAGPPKGLYLAVHPTGTKSWTFRYRWDGKTRKLTYGNYPSISLAAARAEAESAVAELNQNINPTRTKSNERAAKQAEVTVEVMKQESERMREIHQTGAHSEGKGPRRNGAYYSARDHQAVEASRHRGYPET